MELHRDLKALVSLAAYQPLAFMNMEVLSDQEHSLGRKVLSYRPEVDPSAVLRRQPRFLFSFQDIKTEGVRKWLDLKKQCPDGINGLNDINLEPDYPAMCAVFEKFGYTITGKKSFVTYLKAIANEINEQGDCFPFDDIEDWATRTKDMYNDAKHAGKKHVHPAINDLYTYLLEGILVLRIRVAKRLGCDMQKLSKNIRHDPQFGNSLMFRELKQQLKETKTDVQKPDKYGE